MLFKRRTPPTWAEKIRISLWPRRSWLRSTRYVTKRVLRITATPHAVAAGVAAGVFTSFTPFMGLHFLAAFVLAWVIRGNMIAAALGTFFGNPLSFPFIWAATFSTGNFLLGNHSADFGGMMIGKMMKGVLAGIFSGDFAAAGDRLGDIWDPLLYPMLIGGCMLGALFSMPAYFLTKRGTTVFREKRRNRLMEKAAAIQARSHKIGTEVPFAGKA